MDGNDRVAGYGELLEYRDAAGNWWPIYWANGQVDTARLKALDVWIVFEAPDCTGTKYFYSPGTDGESTLPGQQIGPPGRPFWVPPEATWRVRNFAQMGRAHLQSRLDGACVGLPLPNAEVLRATDTTVVTVPILLTTGPLRREPLTSP